MRLSIDGRPRCKGFGAASFCNQPGIVVANSFAAFTLPQYN
jgi:hypothetical protein